MAEAIASGNAPAASNAGNPPAEGKQTSSQPAVEETVSLKKTEHDELQKKAAQASEAQSRADTLEKDMRDLRRGMKRRVVNSEIFTPEEILEVKTKITARLITSDKYRELVGKNPTLAKVLAKNPLDLLEANAFADADDAADQVFDYLDELAKVPEAPAAQPVSSPPAPQPPAVNPNPEGQAVQTPEQKKEEDSSKLPPLKRIEQKIASKITVK